MEGDEYASGEFFTVGKGKTANQSASKEDSHFTVLGITAATEGTLCGVLFEGVVRR